MTSNCKICGEEISKEGLSSKIENILLFPLCAQCFKLCSMSPSLVLAEHPQLFNSASETIETPPAMEIGGWLLLWAIGLVVWQITQIMIIYASLLTLPEEVSVLDGVSLANLGLGYEALSIVLSVVVTVYFYKKKRGTPKLIIAFLLYLFLGNLVGLMSSPRPSPLDFKAASVRRFQEQNLGSSVLISLIWVPYFLVSKRVKRTFVR
jgi:hypothetical protein